MGSGEEQRVDMPRPLGQNRGGYGGEGIDIDHLLASVDAVAAARGWREELFGDAGLGLRALWRPARGVGVTPLRFYMSAGIHGDEPAGPLAVEELLRRDDWPADAEVWLCPCLNPAGFRHSTRENALGRDLNRDYRHLQTLEIRAHVRWLGQQPKFDLAACLHEDWEARGFYLYELNPDRRPSRAEAIIRRVARVCPIDPSGVIDEREAREGIIRPNLDPASRPHWPEAFYLVQHQTRHSYTFEAPSDYALPVRVAALVTAVAALLGTR